MLLLLFIRGVLPCSGLRTPSAPCTAWWGGAKIGASSARCAPSAGTTTPHDSTHDASAAHRAGRRVTFSKEPDTIIPPLLAPLRPPQPPSKKPHDFRHANARLFALHFSLAGAILLTVTRYSCRAYDAGDLAAAKVGAFHAVALSCGFVATAVLGRIRGLASATRLQAYVCVTIYPLGTLNSFWRTLTVANEQALVELGEARAAAIDRTLQSVTMGYTLSGLLWATIDLGSFEARLQGVALQMAAGLMSPLLVWLSTRSHPWLLAVLQSQTAPIAVGFGALHAAEWLVFSASYRDLAEDASPADVSPKQKAAQGLQPLAKRARVKGEATRCDVDSNVSWARRPCAVGCHEDDELARTFCLRRTL